MTDRTRRLCTAAALYLAALGMLLVAVPTSHHSAPRRATMRHAVLIPPVEYDRTSYERSPEEDRANRGMPRTTTTTAAPATTTTTRPRPKVTAPAVVGPLNWPALRQCESGGNYADKDNAVYRGAYQFDRKTWAGVGGAGDPADAPPAEQDMRAAMLYAARGRAPWPRCGRRL